jgi:hypothetical protein
MGDYTGPEKRILLAGLLGGRDRDEVWFKFPDAIETLSERGLVRIGREVMADGSTFSFPLCLSPIGVQEAKRVQVIQADQRI